MSNPLHTILANMAKLPANDQRWILNQLSDAQIEVLKNHQGLALLKSLHNSMPFITSPAKQALPSLAQLLADKPPLYAAIIIEQEDYLWTADFLELHDPDQHIQQALKTQTPHVKPAVKKAVLQEWQQQSAFEICMEQTHG